MEPSKRRNSVRFSKLTLQNPQQSTLAAVGQGSVAQPWTKASEPKPLTLHGKPELLYIGAEFCPVCAVERWPWFPTG